MPVSRYSKQMKAPTSSTTGKLLKPTVYECTRCGELFNKQEHRKNFSTVKSSLWEKNEYKLPICNDCLKFYFNYYLTGLGDAHSAYRRICMKFDMYYSDAIVDSILKNETSSDRIGAYISQLNLPKYQGKTYDNTIEEEGERYLYGDCIYETIDEDGNSINIKVEYEKLKEQMAQRLEDAKEQEPEESDPQCEELFGDGFTLKEQKNMLKFYELQKGSIPPQLLTSLDESIRDMAKFRILQSRAIAINDMKEITNYSTQYNKSRKYVDDAVSSFKKNATSEESSMAITSLIESIEQFCPATIYTNKTIFSDVDGIKPFINRFLLRPMRNFFTGSREMDAEYSVDSGGDV